VQDLALGIADLDTPRRLAAPQRPTAAQMHQMDVHQDSSQDDTEHDSDDNTHKQLQKVGNMRGPCKQKTLYEHQ